MATKVEIIELSLRLPVDVRKALDDASRQSLRTLNMEIVWHLRRSLGRPPSEGETVKQRRPAKISAQSAVA